MVGKIWKKVLFFILIVACLFNIINKLVHKASLDQELESSARYIQQQKKKKICFLCVYRRKPAYCIQ